MALLRYISNRQQSVELGFGKNIATVGRMMNADGSFNVVRERITLWDNTYYSLITMPWRYFFLLILVCYLLLNAIFATIYWSLGAAGLQGIAAGDQYHDFVEAYFFSTQTLTTVGYGRINPEGMGPNIVAALESFTGLLAFALISGILYGRFSRPLAKIVFSENMLVSPYQEGQALMFRMGNVRRSELLETEVQMLVAINQPDDDGNLIRRFFPMPIEISKVMFFSLSWTIVHALNETSPLYGFTEKDLLESNAEFLILVKGVDETYQQLVHARRSYIATEVVWNARFRPVIGRNNRNIPMVMNRQMGDFDMMEGVEKVDKKD